MLALLAQKLRTRDLRRGVRKGSEHLVSNQKAGGYHPFRHSANIAFRKDLICRSP